MAAAPLARTRQKTTAEHARLEMSALYRYLAMGGVALALIIGAYFYGTNRQEKVDAGIYAAATAKAVTAASNKQKKADAVTQAQLEQALVTAQQAVVDMQTLASQRTATIESLTKQVQSNETNPTVAAWAAGRIPDAALSGLCWPSSNTTSTNCNGH